MTEVVDHYIYLGQLITMNSASKEREIKRRITMGWQSFGRASSIFKNQNIPIIQKRQVYDQCITPTVTYGAETWNLTKKQTLKLRTMQRAHKIIMLSITWRDCKTATWIREQTKIRDILTTASKMKWNWAGHLARTTDNRWTKKIDHPMDTERVHEKQGQRENTLARRHRESWTKVARNSSKIARSGEGLRPTTDFWRLK